MSPSPSANVPTVTVRATGVSPKEVSIPIGGQVRFVNNDSVNRQINSNPFPAHDDCPPLNDVGLLTPGQSKMSGILSLQGACGFHEHLTELYRPRVLGQWFDGIRFYAAASSPTRSRRT